MNPVIKQIAAAGRNLRFALIYGVRLPGLTKHIVLWCDSIGMVKARCRGLRMKQQILDSGWKLKQFEPCGQLSTEILDEAAAGADNWYAIEKMPAMVHDVLQAQEIIEEPWKPGRAETYRWISDKDWVYSVKFCVDDVDGDSYLRCMGMDTIVDIYLNGELVASLCNMYMQFRLEITGRLKRENSLVFHFHTVFLNGKPIRTVGDKLVRRSEENYRTYLGPHPCFSRVGVFDNVIVERVGEGELNELVAGAALDESLSDGVVAIQITGTTIGEASLTVDLVGPDESIVTTTDFQVTDPGAFRFKTTLQISHPELWWPRGYGGQPLYRVEAKLETGGEERHRLSRTVGFRTIAMPDPLHFKVNGRPVRLWGGDWVVPRWDTAVWDSDRAKRLLEMAENAHFNTFRVWGSVESPNDEFYEMCSGKGFLIWQDFTNLPLREEPAARKVCREEAKYLVKRLMHHPSIFFWCGCNEAAMWNDTEYGGPGGEWPGRVPFEEEVAPVCRELDPDRPILPSSPYYGVDNNDPQVWNTHGYTNLWFVPGYDYLNFASEDTRIAAPPLKSLERFFAPEDLWPEGYSQSVTYGVELPWPESWEKYTFNSSVAVSGKKTGPVELFHDATNPGELVYRLGMAEAVYYADVIERQRRGYAADDERGKRRCGGYLVWKYNDSWPEIYSAKVDYFLEPYLPYYAIRRSYTPLIVSIDIGAYISVWVVNDGVAQVSGTLTVRLFHIYENAVAAEVKRNVSISPDESLPIIRLDEEGIGSFRREHVIHAELADSEGRVIARASSLADFDRRMVFPDAEVAIAVENGELLLTTDKFARSVFLEGEADGDSFGWFFEDNWFDLLPGESKRVRVLGRHNSGTVTAGAWHSPHRNTADWKR